MHMPHILLPFTWHYLNGSVLKLEGKSSYLQIFECQYICPSFDYMHRCIKGIDKEI